MNDSEEKLIKKAQDGEAEAFGLLYDRHIEPIYRFVFLKVSQKADAEDLTQQVFLNAWQNIHRYQFQGLPFSSWLYKIAHNTIVDYYRLKSSRPAIDIETVSEISIETNNPVMLDQDNDIQIIKRAIKFLPADQQSVVIMKFIEELSNKEIAEALDKTEGAIRVIQHRALKQLKKYFDDQGNHSTTNKI